jgi:hypothetical protein
MMPQWQKKFGLDSICPTGEGKVAVLNIEIHDERLVGGAELMARVELWAAAINGINREKTPAVARLWRGKRMAQNSRNLDTASSQGDGFEARFFGRSLMGKCLAWNGVRRAVEELIMTRLDAARH